MVLKYIANLLEDNIGSLSVLEDLFERPTVVNGDRLVSLVARAIYSGFFRQMTYSINMVQYF